MYENWFKLDRIVDGDTIVVDIDVGFYTEVRKQTIRLNRVDTHETHFVEHDSEEYRRGVKEEEFVAEWFEENDDGSEYPYVIETKEEEAKGSFNRWLGEIKAGPEGECLNDVLLEEFDGVEYEE